MARSATGTLKFQATATIKNTLDVSGSVASAQIGANSLVSKSLTNGVEADEFNRAWEEEITISSGGDVDINLNDFPGRDVGAGSGLDGLGQAMDLQEIVMIGIFNNSTANSGGSGGPMLEVEPATASGWSPIGSHTNTNGGSIGPGGAIIKIATGENGFDVIPGTSESITLTAPSGDVTVRIVVFGRSDDDDSSSSSSTSTQSSSSQSSSSSSQSSSLSSSSSSSSSST